MTREQGLEVKVGDRVRYYGFDCIVSKIITFAGTPHPYFYLKIAGGSTSKRSVTPTKVREVERNAVSYSVVNLI
jgi:hypothetical protein